MRKLIFLLLAVAMLSLAGCKQPAPSDGSIANTEQLQDSTGNTTTEQDSTTDTTTENTEHTSTENTTGTTEEQTEPTKDEPQGTQQPTTQQPTTQTPTTASCLHAKTFVNGSSPANCTTDGFVGATICNDCGKTISAGYSVPATGHLKTEIRNQKDATTSAEGYTGDTVCITCGAVIDRGSSIPKLTKYPVTYTTATGKQYIVDEDVNIVDYTMKLNSWPVAHKNSAVEQEVFRLCNEARAEIGLHPLRWNEDAYCFTQIRADECWQNFSHTRPNGSSWDSVYVNKDVILGYCGENIAGCTLLNNDIELAKVIFDVWMNSPGHRANILRAEYRSVAIAFSFYGFECTAAQNFFDY